VKRDRLTATERENILRLARLGYSDWEILEGTGHARSTIAYHRSRAGIPANLHRCGQRPRRRIPQHVLNPKPVHPAVLAYREERQRRSA
jgi:IS30 family transposase